MRHFRILPAGVALLTGLSLLASGAGSQAFAKSTHGLLSEKQALSAAESLLQIPAKYKMGYESFNSSKNGDSSYNFNFSYLSPDQNQQWINVNVDAITGVIINYGRSTSASGFVFPLPVSEPQAKAMAITWAKKLYPQYYSQVQMQPLAPASGPLNQPISYQFNFERMVNGIPAPFDGFNITISENGHLSGASENWTTSAFPSSKNIMSSVKANQLYQQSLNLYTAYWSNWNASGKPIPYLTYQQATGNYAQWWNNQYANPNSSIEGLPVLNALNGQPINSQGAVKKMPTYTPVHPIVQGGPTISPGLVKVNWSEGVARTYAQKIMQIPANAKLTGANQYQNLPSGNVYWDFGWSLSGGEQYNATVDANTGVLTNFNEYSSKPNPLLIKYPNLQKVKITQSQANAAAADFIKRMFPQDLGGIAVISSNNGNPKMKIQTSFTVEPIVHGIPDVTNTGNLNVSPTTGKVTSYYGSFPNTPEKYPLSTLAISMTMAKYDWTVAMPLKLTYLLTQPQISKGTGIIPQGKVILAYAPEGNNINSGTVMNALTGQFISSNVNPPAYTGVIKGLSGVPQASEIQLLVQHGLLTVSANGSVNPAEDMTRAQFVKLVVDALGNVQPLPYHNQLGTYQSSMSNVSATSPDYSAVYTAFVDGWLKNGQIFQPDQPITRSDAAQILVRALGYGQLLSHPEVFTLHASDAATIPSDQLAADAIANALNMIPLQAGDFNPDGHVTVAEAAQAVVYMVSAHTIGQGIFQGNSGALA